MKKEALALHKKHVGKLAICSKVPLRSAEDLSLSYTPGVAAVAEKIAETKDPYPYTMKSNAVAIVSDGSAVLGSHSLSACW